MSFIFTFSFYRCEAGLSYEGGKSMSWKEDLARDGITAEMKRQLFEILGNQPEITLKGIEEGLYSRGYQRVNRKKIRNFMQSSPKVRFNKKYNDSSTYSLER